MDQHIIYFSINCLFTLHFGNAIQSFSISCFPARLLLRQTALHTLYTRDSLLPVLRCIQFTINVWISSYALMCTDVAKYSDPLTNTSCQRKTIEIPQILEQFLSMCNLEYTQQRCMSQFMLPACLVRSYTAYYILQVYWFPYLTRKCQRELQI